MDIPNEKDPKQIKTNLWTNQNTDWTKRNIL